MEWTLGDRLRKARHVAGYDSAEMAKLVGISRGSISAYENDRTQPGIGTLEKWAGACGVPFDWLCLGQSLTKWYLTNMSKGTAA